MYPVPGFHNNCTCRKFMINKFKMLMVGCNLLRYMYVNPYRYRYRYRLPGFRDIQKALFSCVRYRDEAYYGNMYVNPYRYRYAYRFPGFRDIQKALFSCKISGPVEVPGTRTCTR